jgi:Protein of unknown function (DUF1552)
MIISKKALPRRTFLRGMGVTMALPLLDAMVPALTPIARAASLNARRLGFFYAPNGILQDDRFAPKTATGYDMPLILQSLEPVRKHVLLFNGLDNKMVEPMGDGNGNHQRAAGGWLNGTHILKTEGADVRAGITADQIAARAWANDTKLPSLEFGLDNTPVVGSCAAYSCLYGNTIAWQSEREPLPVENNPGVIFERMFGETSDPKVRRAQLNAQGSILDVVTEQFRRLQRSLGPADRATVDSYLTTVREVEQRIKRAQAATETTVDLPDRPLGIPQTFGEHFNLMLDLLVLAYQTDTTRVATFQVSREESNNTYPEIGVPGGHHGLSHHGRDPEKLAMVAKINAYHLSFFAQFLQRMQALPDGDGTMLDRSLFLWGSGLGDGDMHTALNLSVVLAGGGALGIKSDRFIHSENEPFMNLLLTMLDKAGVQAESLGDSTGKFRLEPAGLTLTAV